MVGMPTENLPDFFKFIVESKNNRNLARKSACGLERVLKLAADKNMIYLPKTCEAMIERCNNCPYRKIYESEENIKIEL